MLGMVADRIRIDYQFNRDRFERKSDAHCMGESVHEQLSHLSFECMTQCRHGASSNDLGSRCLFQVNYNQLGWNTSGAFPINHNHFADGFPDAAAVQ